MNTEPKITYILMDDFNRYTISRHRLLRCAVDAERTFARRVKKNNGRGSYIPTSILQFSAGAVMDSDVYFCDDVQAEKEKL